MTVTGQLRPNEQVVYTVDGSLPTFVRRTYEFKGIGSTANNGAGMIVVETAIVAICRGASVVGDVLPPADELIAGLPQSRVAVRRYERARGNATIVVDWGIRFSGGAGPDAKREQSRTFQAHQEQPYMVVTAGETATLWETQSRSVIRPAVRTRFEKIFTDDGTAADTEVGAILSQVGKLMGWRGKDRLVVGGGFSPFSQTQGYLSITLDWYSPLAALVADEIIAGQGNYGSLPVAALAGNQQYGTPNPTDGTPTKPLPPVIDPFNWMVS